MAIEGNQIAAAGTNDAILSAARRETRRIDLHDRLAVPGFIDNHVHFIDGGFELSRVQLRDAASPQEFARRIGDFAKKRGQGWWILGGQWDEQIWTPYTLPARQMIDAVTPDNPVFVSRLDGHMALANSVALTRAGITRSTPDPPGGAIVRDADGEPTGVLKDTAMSAVFALIPPPAADQRLVAAAAALREAAKFGVTALCDMSSGDDAFQDLRAYQQLDRRHELTARIDLFVPISRYERLVMAGIERSFGSDRLRIGGLKGFSDGSLGSSTAWFFEPFLNEPENHGLPMEPMTKGSMKRWVADADAHNLQIAIHAIGDRANDEVLQIYESLPGNRRFRIEHAQHLNRDLIRRFASDGVIASMQPYHAIDDGRWAETKIGQERAKSTYAFRSLMNAGALVTFGSDWTVAPLNPLLGIYAAVTRRTVDGKNPNGWIPAEKITVDQALQAYTVNNAFAMGREGEIGKIAPGMRADIAILSDDLFKIAPETIESVVVDTTIFDGEVIFNRR